jgi:hypothetical protein
MRRQTPHSQSWRYQHSHAAQDGTMLYAEHPFLVDRYRLSTLPAPLNQSDVLLDAALNDEPALAAATDAFFAAHGGKGKPVAHASGNTFRPYRRQP